MINNKITFSDIKKYLKHKGLIIQKMRKKEKSQTLKKKSDYSVLSKTLLSSLLVISFFSITPVLIEFAINNEMYSKEFENNSKDNFNKTLTNKNQNNVSKVDKGLLEKYVFDDVFNYEDLPSDTVRLNASTIKQLFKDTNYNLRVVRE